MLNRSLIFSGPARSSLKLPSLPAAGLTARRASRVIPVSAMLEPLRLSKSSRNLTSHFFGGKVVMPCTVRVEISFRNVLQSLYCTVLNIRTFTEYLFFTNSISFCIIKCVVRLYRTVLYLYVLRFRTSSRQNS